MKTIKLFTILFLSIIAISCSSDDDSRSTDVLPVNQLKLEFGAHTPITLASTGSEVYDNGISLNHYSREFRIKGTTNSGLEFTMWMSLYTPGDSFGTGTYGTRPERDGIFYYNSIEMEFRNPVNDSNDNEDVLAGTVQVTAIDGSRYSMTLDLLLFNGNRLTGDLDITFTDGAARIHKTERKRDQ